MENQISLRLLCAWHNVRLVLAVVELCCSTQFLILLALGELLQLLQVAWKLVAIQGASDLKTASQVVMCASLGACSDKSGNH